MTEQTWRVPLSDVRVDEEVLAAAHETLASGWWSMGPRVQEFEAAFADMVGAPHAVAVANGTAALHLALLAAGCGPGDEVVVPSLNFVAAANSVVVTGATPVFCDVLGAGDLNLDPDDLEAAVGERTKALLVLHFGGFACDIDRVEQIAVRHGLTLIEDAAHAPRARAGERVCGTIGAAGCFSFFSNKNLPVGEGGMIVTGDEAFAARLRLLRSHGMTTLTWDRHRGHASTYDVVDHGFNYRLDELRAAIGLVQLARLEQENAGRAAVVARYRRELSDVAGLVMPFADRDPESSAHHLAVVVLPPEADRAEVQAQLAARRIQTSVHYPPIHRFSAYAELGGRRPLPQTEALSKRLLTLPLYGHMRSEQVDEVVAALRDALD